MQEKYGKQKGPRSLFLSTRTKVAALVISILLPALLAAYGWYMGNRPPLHVRSEWTFQDTLIQNSDVLLALVFLAASALPFYFVFDRKQAQARDMVPIALMSAMCVVGRAAFALVPLPNFKPVSAIIIITAVAFGPEAGYLTGALAGFLSNFLFGQGPWTPWQMFCWGVVGFLAGLLYQAGLFGSVAAPGAGEGGRRRKPVRLCIYGFLSGFGYGVVMNIYYVLTYMGALSWQGMAVACASSFFFDLSHGICTALVLALAGEAWVRKLLRIKEKFGLAGEDRRYVLPPSAGGTVRPKRQGGRV